MAKTTMLDYSVSAAIKQTLTPRSAPASSRISRQRQNLVCKMLAKARIIQCMQCSSTQLERAQSRGLNASCSLFVRQGRQLPSLVYIVG
jgi:hypothetical protein